MNKKDDFQKFIDVFRSLSLTRNEECLLNEFQRAVDAFPDEKKLTKKAELQESLKNIEWISGPPNMEYVRMIREAQKVVDAMPDDEEKAFDKFLSDEYNSNIEEFQGSELYVDFIVGLQSAWKAAINFKTKGE